MNAQPRQRQMFGPRGGGGHMGGLGRPVEKVKDFRGTLRRLAACLRPFRLRLAVIFAMMALGTLMGAAAPKVLGLAITRLFHGVSAVLSHSQGAHIDHAFLLRIILYLAGLYLLNAALSYLAYRAMSVVAQKTVFAMRLDVDHKLSRLPLSYFDSRSSGEIMSRVANDIDNINNTLQQGLPQLFSSIIGIIGAAVMMLVISPLLMLITIATLPLSFWVTMTIAKKSQGYFVTQQKALGQLNGHVEEMITGHAAVKAFCREKASLAEFEEINGRLYRAGWKAQFVSGFIFPVMNFIGNLGYVAVCVAGGIFVAKKKIEIGDVQAFIQYIRMFTQPVAQSASIINLLQSAMASAERVFEIMDAAEEPPDLSGAALPSPIRGEVRLAGVSFGYDGGARLFDGLDLEVRPGQNVAIVGPTGAGKTTLVNLLMRFYDTSGGDIFIDDVSIRSMPRGALRRAFGMVLQDAWLFKGTIRENIAYARPEAPEEDIVNAARAAHAHHFIRTLPKGYDTMLGEDASNISAGEKQLLTIARALLADPAMLILDEATSSVDTRTEVLIRKAMATLMKDRTCFVIAHRLSTIRDAELILVMNKGKIVEKGTHPELLGANGFYAELYKAQFAGAVID